ncbi:MAG TPA: ATP-dependent 6-phosphofructokinase [Anaerolineaceae bacterium]|nr:ATP-dependent 6-phosphofructokinase [Anaerolineaceae bacterium]
MTKYIGVLTAGGDTPGLNAALRGLGKAALGVYGMQVVGFYDGFRGLMQDRTMRLEASNLSGILTLGGTILGTSRDKPKSMPVGGQLLDMTNSMIDTYQRHHLDALVCLGGGGTQKSAYHLAQHGLNIITLPKTIDNDIAKTDQSFGYDTALSIATEAIDRLHSTAHSHHRIIVVEIMGHNAGWLALGAGLAGGADVILIPEIPYDTEIVAEAILNRNRSGKRFSIVAVAEGAMTKEDARLLAQELEKRKESKNLKDAAAPLTPGAVLGEEAMPGSIRTLKLAARLEELTGLESRITILGHLQRGGTPSAYDRLLATRLGTATAGLINEGVFGVMVAVRGDGSKPVPLEKVVGRRRLVPQDHPWLESARKVGTCLGD